VDGPFYRPKAGAATACLRAQPPLSSIRWMPHSRFWSRSPRSVCLPPSVRSVRSPSGAPPRHLSCPRGRIDLRARLWTCADGLHRRHNKGRPGSASASQQGASGQHTVCTLGARKPATTPGADDRAFRHSRSLRVGGEQSLWHPDPEPLDLVHERRVDHVRFGPRRGGDLLRGRASAPSATPAPSPVRSDSPAQCPARSVEGRNQSRPDWFRSGATR
jgi:hypothetical protein